MDNREIAEKVYLKFSKAEGNQHIASLYALVKILNLLDENRPKRILEVGMGIGSVSTAIFEYAAKKNIRFEYHGTEANEFCLNQLHINLGDQFRQISLFSDIDSVPQNSKYDLIIIDGSDSSLEKLANLISSHGVIFIEGDRAPQEAKIRKLFPRHKFCISISNFKNPSHGPFSPRHWSSGGKTIYVDPTTSQKIHRLIEKVRTALLYKKRSVLK